MATTRSRPRGREHARPSTGGVAAEHATKIYSVALSGIVIVVAFLALTSVGHVIDAATQHFMLYYAGVFALIALCASVGLGLVATDRIVLNPGHRVFVQAAHRAASFGAVTFLIIHIATEILAQRSHLLDAVVPFLSPFRPFYIGLGTIASDLIVLLVITGILRGRFTAHGKAWRWRAIHYTSYVAFVFGVWHGLLGGRPGKPYVDWSYGFVVAFVAVGLAVRVLANSLRPKENLSSPPVDLSASSASAPLRAAAMFATARNLRGGRLGMTTGAQPMLSAPVTADTGPRVLTALPAGASSGTQADGRQPFYEPGYEGPPRYLGAPSRATSGPMPRATSGPMPRATSGPMPRANSGPMPAVATDPMPRAGTGPMPQAGGRAPAAGRGMAGPGQGTGPLPRAATGPMPRAGAGPMPGVPTGPLPRAATGPLPRAGTGPMPGVPTGPQARPGPAPRAGTGPMPGVPGGPQPRPATGPLPRAGTGPMPQAGGPVPPGRGPIPQAGGPTPPYGYAAPPYGYAAQPPVGQGSSWNFDQPPWDGGAPEPDPGFRYREPGPGMPGYRWPREQHWSGPLEQHWG